MLIKLKKHIKKEVVINKNPFFKPYFENSRKELDLTNFDYEIDEAKLYAELEKAYAEGKELNLLKAAADRAVFHESMQAEKNKFDAFCDETQNILHKKMKDLYNEEEVLKLMENPDQFFNRGWCYPTPYSAYRTTWYSFRKDGLILTGSGYNWNFTLDKEFYKKPENLYALYKCAVQHFGAQTRKVLNDLDENVPYAENDLRKLFKEYWGFKAQFETYANSQYEQTSKILTKVTKRLELEPTEEDEEKQAILSKNLPEYAKLREFTFKGEKLLIDTYKSLCPGDFKEGRASCGLEIM